MLKEIDASGAAAIAGPHGMESSTEIVQSTSRPMDLGYEGGIQPVFRVQQQDLFKPLR